MPQKRRFCEVHASYRRSRVFLKLRPKTQTNYMELSVHPLRYFKGYWLSWSDEDIRGKLLTPAIVDDYIGYRLSSPNRRGGTIAETTVQKELIVCSNAVEYVVHKEYVNVPNPFKGCMRGVRQGRREVILPRDKDADLLIALIQPVRDIAEFILEVGFRKGEVLALTRSRIDGDRVRFSPADQKSGRTGVRRLSKRAMEIVSRQPDGELVFTVDGGPVRKDWLRYHWERGTQIAGLQGLTPHDLRRTFATRALEKGVPLAAIREQLGHATEATTERVYTVPQDGLLAAQCFSSGAN